MYTSITYTKFQPLPKVFKAVKSQLWVCKKRFAGSKRLNNLLIAKDDID